MNWPSWLSIDLTRTAPVRTPKPATDTRAAHIALARAKERTTAALRSELA